jgi:hypothetical protein
MSGRTQRTARRAGVIASLLAALALVPAGAAQGAALPAVSLTINKTSITASGALQSGAVGITITATGVKEPEPALVLLKPGVTPESFYAYLATNKITSDANAIGKFGSLVYDAAGPGETQVVLQPGVYVAANAEGEKSSTWTHSSFTVTAAASPAALPAAQATEKTIDFGFRGPSVLHVGELVRFENEGYLVHMDIAFEAKSKSAAAKVLKGLATGHEKGLEKLSGGPPADFAGPLSQGSFQQEVITAKPGYYVQVCFMQTQDGRPHALIGMERIIKITS